MQSEEAIAKEEEKEMEMESLIGSLPSITREKVMTSKMFGEMSKIDSCIFLGSSYNAFDANAISSNNIKHIINVCENEMDYSYPGVTKHYKRVQYRSNFQNRLFLGLCQLIEKARKVHEPVFIHCVRGRSRSVLIVLCYLMYSEKMDLKQALDYVRMRRPVINPIECIQEQAANFYFFLDKENKFHICQ